MITYKKGIASSDYAFLLTIAATLSISLLLLTSCGAGNTSPDNSVKDSCAMAKKYEGNMTRKEVKASGISGDSLLYWDNEKTIIHSRHTFKNGELLKSIYYYEDGKIKEEANFKCGSVHGIYLKFYDNGAKENVFNYSYGYRNGVGLFYNEKDTLIGRFVYSMDKIVGTPEYFDDNGKLISDSTAKKDSGNAK